ncbi:hypothetical protein J4208_01830 [Candidatus Woesearchaeota archaeon]|nr:hypothetical protein [Candidatus Woesearchaeota archaeon]
MGFLTATNKLLTTTGYTLSAGLYFESYRHVVTALLTDNAPQHILGIGYMVLTTLVLGTTTRLHALQPKLEHRLASLQLQKTSSSIRNLLDSGEIV